MKITSFQTQVACPSASADPAIEPTAAQMANFVTLELRTDDGLTGIGYCGFVGVEMLKALQATVDALAGWTLGADPYAVEAISSKLLMMGGLGAPAGMVTSAAAAIDVALWDIKGKAAGQPLFRLLGGESNRVPTYASGYLWRNYSGDQLANTAAELIEKGFRAMKFRMGDEPSLENEIDRMDALMSAVDDDTDVMVDINQGWTVELALVAGKAMEAYELTWLEDPIHHQDYSGLAHLADKLSLPIATGEYHYGVPPFGELLERRAVDIVMVDLLRAGGITHWMKAAHAAEAFNKPVVSHLAPEILGHCVEAVPNGTIAEHMPWAFPLFQEVPQVSAEDGALVLSEEPGLGLRFDQDAIDRMQPE
ncbi:MAG: mandelate racemase/muconate lactonizing enzyme family protein [Acidobacteriia bacterium]|nr:mandelate racemase/muconate lactonizing enzyme family protein [Terriglobia bacterium]